MENFALRWLLYVCGWVSFALGVIGAFLPILPTTPFLILSAFLFSKSSPRVYSWLISLPHFGDAIMDWERSRVIRPRAKVMSTVMILLAFGYSIFFTDLSLGLRVMLSCFGIGSLSFILTRKSAP